MLLKLLYTSDTRRCSSLSSLVYSCAVLTAAASALKSHSRHARKRRHGHSRHSNPFSPRDPGLRCPHSSLRPSVSPQLRITHSPRVPAPAILAPTTKRKKLCASVPLSLRNSVLMRLPHAQALSHYRPTRLSASLCLSSLLLHTNTQHTHTFASTHAHIAPTRKRVHAHDRLKNTHGTMPRPLFVAHHLDEDMSFTASCSPSPP